MSPISHHDPALETLVLPFTSGRLSWPAAGTLFLRARGGAWLKQFSIPNLVCQQSFRPDALALEQAGFTVSAASDPTGRFPLVLLLPPRQRDESRALMAHAVESLTPGGVIVASVSNNEGARSLEGDLDELAGPVETLTKNKCRVFWTQPLNGPRNAQVFERWRTLDATRPVVDGQFVSRPGVFAWDRIDPASRLLADHLPADLRGEAADLGSGFGFLSAQLLARCPGIKALDVYEAEARALELTQLNLAPWTNKVKLGFKWHDVTSGLPRQYDVIVTNPPFHTHSRIDRPDIGRRFIAVAAQSLRPGGQLWLVANRHLPYEEVLTGHFAQMRTVAAESGFKVIAAVKTAGQ